MPVLAATAGRVPANDHRPDGRPPGRTLAFLTSGGIWIERRNGLSQRRLERRSLPRQTKSNGSDRQLYGVL